MAPMGYNNAYEIMQTPDYVLIRYEIIHDMRIIPLDGRAPLHEQHPAVLGAIRAAGGRATRWSSR